MLAAKKAARHKYDPIPPMPFLPEGIGAFIVDLSIQTASPMSADQPFVRHSGLKRPPARIKTPINSALDKTAINVKPSQVWELPYFMDDAESISDIKKVMQINKNALDAKGRLRSFTEQYGEYSLTKETLKAMGVDIGRRRQELWEATPFVLAMNGSVFNVPPMAEKPLVLTNASLKHIMRKHVDNNHTAAGSAVGFLGEILDELAEKMMDNVLVFQDDIVENHLIFVLQETSRNNNPITTIVEVEGNSKGVEVSGVVSNHGRRDLLKKIQKAISSGKEIYINERTGAWLLALERELTDDNARAAGQDLVRPGETGLLAGRLAAIKRLSTEYVSKFPETKESAELCKLDMLETEARSQDSVYVENLSELNSGEMSGGWVELPYRGNLTAKLEEIGSVLPPDQFGNERSEVAVTDVDLNGPLADLGVRGGQWVKVDQLNVVAGVVAGMKHEALAAAAAYIEDQNLNDDLLAVANVALQADEIGWRSFEGGPIDQSRRHEELGYALVEDEGGIGAVAQGVLEEYFDYGALGRDEELAGSVELRQTGWVSEGGAEAPYRYSLGTPHERYGMELVDDLGGLGSLSRDELEQHFDYKGYGYDMAVDDVKLCKDGYYPADADIDLERYSWHELEGIAADSRENGCGAVAPEATECCRRECELADCSHDSEDEI